MALSFGVTTRGAAWALLSAFGVLGCQEPGADWVPDDGAGNSSASHDSASGPVTGVTTTSTAASDGTASDGTASDGGSSTVSSTSAGGMGGGLATSGETTAGGSATTSDTNETTTTGGDTTTGSGGSGGSGGGSGSSLITNGDFSAGEADWSLAGSGTVDTAAGEYCVTLTADGEVSVGWPSGVDAAVLEPGTSYQLSYLAYFTGSMAPILITKVGQAFDPYASFVEEDATLTGSPMTFSHAFSVDSEEQAGLLFRVQGVTGDVVCFDDVVLTAQ